MNNAVDPDKRAITSQPQAINCIHSISILFNQNLIFHPKFENLYNVIQAAARQGQAEIPRNLEDPPFSPSSDGIISCANKMLTRDTVECALPTTMHNRLHYRDGDLNEGEKNGALDRGGAALPKWGRRTEREQMGLC